MDRASPPLFSRITRKIHGGFRSLFIAIVGATLVFSLVGTSSADAPIARPSPKARLPFLRRYAPPEPLAAKPAAHPNRSPASMKKKPVKKPRRKKPSAKKPKAARATPHPSHRSRSTAPTAAKPRAAAPPVAAPPAPPGSPLRQPARVVPSAAPTAYGASPSGPTTLNLRALPFHSPTPSKTNAERTIKLDMTHPYSHN
jgi:hypothetical protein